MSAASGRDGGGAAQPSAQPSAPASPRRPPPPRRAPVPRDVRDRTFGARLRDPLLWAFLLLGAWLGRVSAGADNDFGVVIDLAMVGGSAFLLALWYRRRVRATLAQRRADREHERTDDEAS